MLNNEFPPLGGGTGSVNLALMAEFARSQRVQCDLITSSGSRKYEQEQFGDGVHVFRLPIPRSSIHHASNVELLRYAIRSYMFASKLLKQQSYDLLFGWSSLPSGAVVCGLSRAFHIPYVVRISGPEVPGFEARYTHTVRLLLPLLRQVWKRASKVIYKSEYEQSALVKVGVRENLLHIPNGVTVSAASEKQNYELHTPIRLVCVSRVVARKNHELLVRGIHALQERGVYCELHIIGDGDAILHLQELAATLQIQERIRFHGYVAREQIPGLVRECDLFVLASHQDAMSVAVLEAVGMKIPTILSRAVGMNAILHDRISTLYFAPDSLREFTEQVCFALKSAQFRRDVAENAHQALARYSWDVIADRYVNSFKEILQDEFLDGQ